VLDVTVEWECYSGQHSAAGVALGAEAQRSSLPLLGDARSDTQFYTGTTTWTVAGWSTPGPVLGGHWGPALT
jgi:hypothetical protein